MDTLMKKMPPIGQLGPFIALADRRAFFAVTTDRFFSAQNMSLILRAGDGGRRDRDRPDLDHPDRRHRPHSCGMIMALGSIVMTKFAADFGMPWPFAVLCGIAVTALFGLFNGLLVTRVKLPPFIVTLGMFNIAFAITQLYSQAQTVTDIPEGDDLARQHLRHR